MSEMAGRQPGQLDVRTVGHGSNQNMLALLAGFAGMLALVQVVVGWDGPADLWITIAFTLVFGTWAAAGVIALWRRPTSGTGALLLVGALALFLSGTAFLGFPAFVVLREIFATSVLAITIHLLHAFPSGRLRGRLSIVTVVAVYVVSLVLQAPLYLLPAEQSALLLTASWVQRLAGLTVVIVTTVYLIGRLRTAGAGNRRVLVPLYAYGILAVLLIPVSAGVLPLLGADSGVVGIVQLAIIAGIPIAFLIGVLAGRFSRTAEADALSAWLSLAGSGRTTVSQALARSLGDDSLRVVYWSDDTTGFVDEWGVEVRQPDVGTFRVWQEVHVESRLVGSIEYDTRMIAAPDSVRRAAQVLALALDRERLTAALVASNDALVMSRLRLVEAADRERARIARDLHDGLQVQLVLLALEAQQLADAEPTSDRTAVAATTLRQRIDEAAVDLRRLVNAVLPAALVERGLSAATEDLVDRLDILATLESNVDDRALAPATAQTAYLIVAEALTNAVKHSGASSVLVRLDRTGDRLRVMVADDGHGGASIESGTGLKGLVDRVEALGGSLTLTSAPDRGTELRAELPAGP